MANHSKIEWTGRTWNPVSGCTKISAGCDNCYAERLAERFRGTIGHPYEQGFDLVLHPERLDQPGRWRKPSLVFVCSMADLFHKDVPREFIDRVFDAMEAAPRHQYQLLTKRSSLMRDYVNARWRGDPPAHIWLGVSVENQQAASRVVHLLNTNAAVRFLSCEPLLGPLRLTSIDVNGDSEVNALVRTQWGEEIERWRCSSPDWQDEFCDWYGLSEMPNPGAYMMPAIDWVIAGGESGPGARPMHPDWARSLRDQCQAPGVPFFFKQWGDWFPGEIEDMADGINGLSAFPDIEHDRTADTWEGKWRHSQIEGAGMLRVGKKRAGRHLDGCTHDDFPKSPIPQPRRHSNG